MTMFYTVLQKADAIALRRKRRIALEGSPPYRYPVGAVAASAFVQFDVGTQFSDSRKYEPLDWVEIVNNDAVHIRVFINGNISVEVPAGVIRLVEDQALWQIRVLNLDGVNAITANAITLTLQRSPLSADKVARLDHG